MKNTIRILYLVFFFSVAAHATNTQTFYCSVHGYNLKSDHTDVRLKSVFRLDRFTRGARLGEESISRQWSWEDLSKAPTLRNSREVVEYIETNGEDALGSFDSVLLRPATNNYPPFEIGTGYINVIGYYPAEDRSNFDGVLTFTYLRSGEMSRALMLNEDGTWSDWYTCEEANLTN